MTLFQDHFLYRQLLSQLSFSLSRNILAVSQISFEVVNVQFHWFLFCTPTPPPPPGNSSLVSHFASKILTFKTPLPLGLSEDLPWGGYGFFLELHMRERTPIPAFVSPVVGEKKSRKRRLLSQAIGGRAHIYFTIV